MQPGDIILTARPNAWLGRAILYMESEIEGAPARWGHAMTYIGGGQVISQDWRVKRHPLTDYSDQTLKVWHNPALSSYARQVIVDYNLHALRREYDVLGLVGQAFRLVPYIGTWLADHIQEPWCTYCSELVCMSQRAADVGFVGGIDHCQIDPQDIDDMCWRWGWQGQEIML